MIPEGGDAKGRMKDIPAGPDQGDVNANVSEP
jgi:hypothetical protein